MVNGFALDDDILAIREFARCERRVALGDAGHKHLPRIGSLLAAMPVVQYSSGAALRPDAANASANTPPPTVVADDAMCRANCEKMSDCAYSRCVSMRLPMAAMVK